MLPAQNTNGDSPGSHVVLHKQYWLVVEPTPLRGKKLSWDDYSQYVEK